MPNSPNRLSRFWQELKRRRVLPFVIGYFAACIAIISFLLESSDVFSVPENTIRLLYLLAAVGIPIVIILPWYINRQRGKELNEESTRSEIPVINNNSIIVLPFENISNDPEQDYFSDGLTEEIITDLSYIDDLLVISRSSAMTFKGTKKTLKEITNAVKVRFALEGSVRKAGNNIRIIAQLIDGTNDSHIWADKYNGTLEDIFDIQEKVSRSIADALKIKLSTREKEKIDQRPIDNAFAYDCYKKASPELTSMSKERLDYGINLLQKGLEVTGENAVIYSGIALAYMQYANIGIETENNLTIAEEYLQKALDTDPELPEAHLALGGILLFKNENIFGTLDHWKRAHLKNPENPDVILYLALVYTFVGRNDTALKLMERMVRIDPINPMCDAGTGWVHLFSGRYQMAIDPLFAAFRLSPDNPMHQFFKALILLYNDRANEAFDFINEVVDELNMNNWTRLTLFIKYAIKGDKDKVGSLLTPEFVLQTKIDLQNSFHIATFLSYLDEKAEALKWLENAVNRGFINYPLLNEQDILLNNIRKEESFKALMNRVKEKWEKFELS